MKVITAFILKHYFLILFLTFEFFSISLLVLNNSFHNASYFNSSNFLIGSIYETYNGVTEYIDLADKNDVLAKEIAKLRSREKLSYIRYDITTGLNNTVTHYEPQYKYIDAKVINNSVNKKHNYITINKGSAHGIKKNMGVIFDDAVVGIVKNVSNSYSSIMSILHTESRIGGKLNGSKYFGSVRWYDDNDYKTGRLIEVPIHVKVNDGDTISTTSYSGIFPEGMLFGYAKGSEKDDSEQFLNIDFEIHLDFKKLSHVYVVENFKRSEKEELEKTNDDD